MKKEMGKALAKISEITLSVILSMFALPFIILASIGIGIISGIENIFALCKGVFTE